MVFFWRLVSVASENLLYEYGYDGWNECTAHIVSFLSRDSQIVVCWSCIPTIFSFPSLPDWYWKCIKMSIWLQVYIGKANCWRWHDMTAVKWDCFTCALIVSSTRHTGHNDITNYFPPFLPFPYFLHTTPIAFTLTRLWLHRYLHTAFPKKTCFDSLFHWSDFITTLLLIKIFCIQVLGFEPDMYHWAFFSSYGALKWLGATWLVYEGVK